MSCTPGDHNDVTTKFCPHCGEQLQIDPLRVQTFAQLAEVAAKLGVRPDWHAPDEQEVTARVWGHSFDNAGTWPYDPRSTSKFSYELSADAPHLEMYVELLQAGKVVAQVNLATLFAMACRTYPFG